MPNFDEIDKKIIDILLKDATVSHTDLAKQVNVSEATIRRRINKLIEDDVFVISAVVNPFKLGYTVMALIGLQVDMLKVTQVERELVNMPEVRFLGLVLGQYDFFVEAWFLSSDELLEFVTSKLARIDGVRHSETHQIMRLSKYTYDWGTVTAWRNRP